MKRVFSFIAICAMMLAATNIFADLYGDPPDADHAYQVHDQARPRPPIVTPGKNVGDPPSDATILFDGTSLDNWEADKPEKGVPTKWKIVDGTLESVKGAGYIRTKQEFGDCQLHVEWATPNKVQGDSQGRGNSGVFLMGVYELQVLDCYENDTYPDGQAGSIYAQNPPDVNVSRPPGEWQTYDVIFRQPRMKDGKLDRPGYVTVMHNGVFVQDHWILEGPTGHMSRPKLRKEHADKGSFKIQDHGNPVHFRNIWIRELTERSDGGLKGPFRDPEVIKAKQMELAAGLREEAKESSDKIKTMNKLMESLAYEPRPDTTKEVEGMLNELLLPLKDAGKEEVVAKRGQIMAVRNSLKYITRHGIVAKDFGPSVIVETLVKKYELDKK